MEPSIAVDVIHGPPESYDEDGKLIKKAYVCFHSKWGDGASKAHIQAYSNNEALDSNKVNLSRSGDGADCWFRVTELNHHDGHAPAWLPDTAMYQDMLKEYPGRGWDAMQAYISRVMADVEKACMTIEIDAGIYTKKGGKKNG